MDTVAAIYDALDDDAAFAVLPDVLAQAAGARSGILQAFTPEWDIHDARVSYFTPEMLDRYVGIELYRLDPWRVPALRPENFNRVVAFTEAVPVERIIDTPFFHENFRYWGDDTAHCLGGGFQLERGFASVGMHRGVGAQPFSPDDAAAMQHLIPHLRRLLDLRFRLASADANAALSEAALDAQPNAVFIVNAAGQPILMNRQGEVMIALGESCVLDRAGLRAKGESARAFADAISTACARVGSQGAALRLQRPAGPPLRVIVTPLRAGHRTHALIVVDDPAWTDPCKVENLRNFYGLTGAEAEIAAALAKGMSPAGIAQLRGVSITTTRTQIRDALRKTGARNIVELVATVASAPTNR